MFGCVNCALKGYTGDSRIERLFIAVYDKRRFVPIGSTSVGKAGLFNVKEPPNVANRL